MAHEIGKHDSPMYGSRTPAWHGLGTVVDGQPNIADAMRIAKLDWDVELRPVYVERPNGEFTSLPSYRSIVRMDTEEHLGVVGSRYTPILNSESFAIVDDLCSQGARIESCGSLKDGRLVWVLAVLPQTLRVKDDKIAEYLLLSTSHDGSKPLTVGITPVRVVCWNTLSMALTSKNSQSITVRHTKGSADRVRQAASILASSREYFLKAGETFNRWADNAIDARFASAYLKALFPSKADKDARAVGKVMERLDSQPGATMEALNGGKTAYGLFNAVTDYLDYSRTAKGDVGAGRLAATWFGSGVGIRNRAAGLLDRALAVKSDPAELAALANVD